MTPSHPAVAGLDIARATLRLHLQNAQHVFANSPQGCGALLQKLGTVPGVQVVCEGGHACEQCLVAALRAARHPVTVLTPAQVRRLALAPPLHTSSDPCDAELLARLLPHHSTTPPLPHSAAPPILHSTTPSLHHSITPSPAPDDSCFDSRHAR